MSPAIQVTWSLLLIMAVGLVMLVLAWRHARPRRRDDDGGPDRAPQPQPGPLPPCLVPTAQWRAPDRTRELA